MTAKKGSKASALSADEQSKALEANKDSSLNYQLVRHSPGVRHRMR